MIHAHFLLTGTRGGRLSSRNPNLQNLPRKGAVKKLYASRFGNLGAVYGTDLSQIELRLLACACGDPSMLEAYEKDLDLHSLTASRITRYPTSSSAKTISNGWRPTAAPTKPRI
jgi:DNA polymerase-1